MAAPVINRTLAELPVIGSSVTTYRKVTLRMMSADWTAISVGPAAQGGAVKVAWCPV
jgi:hypothetical protein